MQSGRGVGFKTTNGVSELPHLDHIREPLKAKAGRRVTPRAPAAGRVAKPNDRLGVRFVRRGRREDRDPTETKALSWHQVTIAGEVSRLF